MSESGSSPGDVSQPAAPASSVADRVGLIVGSNALINGVDILQGILLVRLMAKAEYGAWSFAMVVFGTTRDLGLLALPESILYFAPNLEPAHVRGLVRQSALLLFGLGVVASAILAGVGFASLGTGAAGGLDAWRVLLPLALASLCVFPMSAYGSAFVATNNHRAGAGARSFVALLRAGALLVAAGLGASLPVLASIYAANAAAGLAVNEWVFRKVFAGARTARFPAGIRAQLRYALPIASTKVTGILSRQLDKLVVGFFFGSATFAEFSVGARELPLVTVLPYSIASTILPMLVSTRTSAADAVSGARGALKLWHASIEKATIVMLPVAGFVLLEAVPLMEVVYGSGYAAAATPFRIYALLLPVRVTSYGIMLLALGESGSVFRIHLVSAVFNVVASLALVHVLGPAGPAAATVASTMFVIVCMLYRIHSFVRVGLRGIFPFAFYGRTAMCVLVALIPVLAFRWLVRVESVHLPPVGEVVVALPLFAASYLALASRMRVLGAEDKAFVLRWLRLEPLRRAEPAAADAGSAPSRPEE